jgi:hypothetical protein
MILHGLEMSAELDRGAALGAWIVAANWARVSGVPEAIGWHKE